MKNNIQKIIVLSALGCYVFAAGYLICDMADVFKDTIKPNQVWRWTGTNDNPFKKPSTVDYKVIDVKDGYVKYVDLKDNDTTTSTKHWFYIGSELIKKQP